MGAGSSRADAQPRRRGAAAAASRGLGLAGCFGGGSTGGDSGGFVATASSSSRAHEVESWQAARAVAGIDFPASVAPKDIRISSESDRRVHPSSSTISHHLRFNHINSHENKEGALGTEIAETSVRQGSSGKEVMPRGNFSNEAAYVDRTAREGISHIGRSVLESSVNNAETDTVCIPEVGGSVSESGFSSQMTSERIMADLEDGEIALYGTSSTTIMSSERSDTSQSSLTSVLPATSTAPFTIGESVPDTVPSRADVPIFSGTQGQIGGDTLHDDMMSIFSNDGLARVRDLRNNETRRSHRRVLWDAFSRRSSRGYLDSDTDDLGFYSRWLDIGDELFADEIEEARFFHRRRHGSLRIREHRRAVFDSGTEQSTVACPLGIHQIGRCTCDSFLIAEESSARASISRIVMLTEALFEVLDEIHRQPASLSLSMVSAQAPESVVNSLPWCVRCAVGTSAKVQPEALSSYLMQQHRCSFTEEAAQFIQASVTLCRQCRLPLLNKRKSRLQRLRCIDFFY
uniref:Uncharacterized protein n=1 Tax=Leersia perrieri TaxID=77586 RepID=A0A0D9VM76_9ORYZ